MATAVLTVALNGGGPASGGITCAAGDTVQLGAVSTVGWVMSPAPVWRILAFPVTFTVPASWSTDVDGTYFYQGVSPPSFAAPSAANWGMFRFSLAVSQLPVDQATFMVLRGPNGEYEIAPGLTNQFDANWAKTLNRTIHAGAVPTLTGTTATIQANTTLLETAAGDLVATIHQDDTSTLKVDLPASSTYDFRVNNVTFFYVNSAGLHANQANSYAELSGAVTLSDTGGATTWADVPGLSITTTTLGNAVDVIFNCSCIGNLASYSFRLKVDATSYSDGSPANSPSYQASPCIRKRISGLSAASHTFKVQYATTATGTITISCNGNPGAHANLTVREVI